MNNITDQTTEFIIIGAAILDILARPVDGTVFSKGSIPAEQIAMQTGGDALNEALVLAALDSQVRLVTRTGRDSAGEFISARCRQAGIDTRYIRESESNDTGINIVLVDQKGERHFVTNPSGSLRRLTPDDIPGSSLKGGKFLSFASIFVSPFFGAGELAQLFVQARKEGLIICADITRCKNGETVEDMREALKFIDYIFPNYGEACMLTGLSGLDEIADAFLSCGTGHVIIKTGEKGCFIKTDRERYCIPPYKDSVCIDTTGAGDTFTACFLYALNKGFPLPECGKFANAGASICIEQIGASGFTKNPAKIWERYLACGGQIKSTSA